MPTIYNIPGKENNNPNNLIPSKDYVDKLIFMLINIINTHEYDLEAHTEKSKKLDKIIDLSFKYEPINVQSNTINTTIPVDMIDTDANHQFISTSLVNTFKDKPSKLDLDNAINDLRSEILMKVDQYFTNILNTKDALQKIKDIFSIVNNDDTLNSLLDTLSNKVSEDEFNEHINSSIHLNNNDRKAINLLLSFIKSGCADWNADKDTLSYIRNKPDAMPADGGNADTVGNYSVDQISNKQLSDAIIGTYNQNYDKVNLDYIIDKDNYSFDKIINIINDSHRGIYSFKTGMYRTESIVIDNSNDQFTELIINGSSKNTIFNVKNMNITGYVTFKDITITNATIIIGTNCKFDNVTFRNCDVKISGNNNIIKWCDMINSNISYTGPCFNNIISYNRSNVKLNFSYNGGNNIISNNIEF